MPQSQMEKEPRPYVPSPRPIRWKEIIIGTLVLCGPFVLRLLYWLWRAVLDAFMK
jgi:hypothetical protein